MINMRPCRAQAPALSRHIIAISKARLMCDFIGLQMLLFIIKANCFFIKINPLVLISQPFQLISILNDLKRLSLVFLKI